MLIRQKIFPYPSFWIFNVTSVNESMTLMTITFRIVAPVSPFSSFVSVSIQSPIRFRLLAHSTARSRLSNYNAGDETAPMHDIQIPPPRISFFRFVSRRWAFLSKRDYGSQREAHCHSLVKSIRFEALLPYSIPLINMLFPMPNDNSRTYYIRWSRCCHVGQNNFETFVQTLTMYKNGYFRNYPFRMF